MSNTLKKNTDLDADLSHRQAFNDSDASHSITGFLTAIVGRKVTQTISTTTSANDTLTFAFSENGTALYSFKIIYTDSTYATMLSAERIA